MTDQTLFSDDNEDPVIDPDKNYFEELVGDGKKYKDPVAAGRALVEKDAFIEKLKAEAAGLRQELNTRLKLEEVVDRISSNKSPSSEQEPNAHEQDTDKSALDPAKVKELIAQTISEDAKKSQREKNIAFVEEKLQEAFGPTFRRTLKSEAQKMGIGEAFAMNLAAEQPHAFLKLFDVTPRQEAPSTATSVPRSEVNSEAFRQRPNDGVKRKSYYDAIRKKDPRRYWSVAVQNEQHREALKQGASFFDT